MKIDVFCAHGNTDASFLAHTLFVDHKEWDWRTFFSISLVTCSATRKVVVGNHHFAFLKEVQI